MERWKGCRSRGCPKPRKARGYCIRHYMERRRRGDFTSQTCSAPGCDDSVSTRGYCTLHYNRWRQTGSVADPDRKEPIWINLAHRRTQLLLRLIREHHFYYCIAARFGFCAQYVPQILTLIATHHGVEVIVELPCHTFGTLARSLGCTTATLEALAREHSIRPPARGVRCQCRQRPLSEDQTLRLTHLYRERFIKICQYCNRQFTVRAAPGLLRNYCYRKRCVQRQKADRYRRGLKSETHCEWHTELISRFTGVEPTDPPETWVTAATARRLTGLSKMQLDWLRKRGIVTVRAHASKKSRTGEPAATFAPSQLAIVQKIYQAWKVRAGRAAP